MIQAGKFYQCFVSIKRNLNFYIQIYIGAAHARREVVQFGLEGNHEHYHYCDFDRLLTWIKTDIDELRQVIRDIQSSDFLVLGRTEQAFQTHPKEWIETERITNKIFSLEIGRQMDITAGSCAFTKRCAEYILRYSEAAMTDAEWPMIAWRIAEAEVDVCHLDGLTYLEVFNNINHDIPESERWLGRLRLSYVISETVLKTGKLHVSKNS